MKYKEFTLALIGVAVFAGCASVDPRNIPQTEYDKSETYRIPEEYVPVFKKLIRSEKKSVAINVNTDAASGKIDSSMAGQGLQAELQSAIDSLGYLRAVSANDDLVSFINAGYGGNVPEDLPDYILLCKLTYVSAVKDAAVQTAGVATTAGLGVGTVAAASEGNRTSALTMGTGAVAAGVATATMVPRKVNIRTYFELYDRDLGATVFSRTIAKEEAGVADSGVENAVLRLFALASKEYMEQVASKIGPMGQVLKTTASGKYAYVSIGSDAGLAKDGYVRFLKCEKYEDDVIVSDDEEDAAGEDDKKMGRNESLNFESVAEGRVVVVKPTPLVETQRAWVEIVNYEKANPLVMRGMAVRIVPVFRKSSWWSHIGIGGSNAD